MSEDSSLWVTFPYGQSDLTVKVMSIDCIRIFIMSILRELKVEIQTASFASCHTHQEGVIAFNILN